MEEMSKNDIAEKSEIVSEFIKILSNKENEELFVHLSSNDLKTLITNIIKIYALKEQTIKNEEDFGKEMIDSSILTDTDIMFFVNRLLESADLDLFEVQFYRSFCHTN